MFRHRILAYQQPEQNDCGITCIRIIARYFGFRYSATFLRRLCDSSRLGITIKDLTATFNKIGFNAIPLRLGMDKLREMPLPAILFWKQHHFLVIYKIKNGRFYVADPDGGKMRFRENDIRRYWLSGNDTGLVILAEPDETVQERAVTDDDDDSNPLLSLIGMVRDSLRKNLRSFVAVVLLSLFVMGADVAIPIVFQETVDTGITTKDIGLVWALVITQVMIFLKNGRIAETGNHHDLMKKGGEYYHLVSSQLEIAC